MQTVDRFLEERNWQPQQVQDYMPLAMTMGCAMYCSGLDADGNHLIDVKRGLAERREQRDVLHRKKDPAGNFKNSGNRFGKMPRKKK